MSLHRSIKEAAVPNPFAVIKDWAAEQVTAIYDVWRPLPVPTSSRR